MDKKTMIALGLTIVVLFFFQMYFAPKPEQGPAQPPPAKEAPAKVTEQKSAEPQGSVGSVKTATSLPATTDTRKAKADIVVETPLFKAVLTDLGAGFKQVTLKKYNETVKGSGGKTMIEDVKPFTFIPKLVKSPLNGRIDDRTNYTPSRQSFTVTDSKESITFTGAMEDGTPVKKTYTFHPDRYTVDIKIDVPGGEGKEIFADFAVITGTNPNSYVFKGSFVYDGKKLNQIDKIEKPVDVGTNYRYTGFDEGYFAFIWMPATDTKPSAKIVKTDTSVPVLQLKLDNSSLSGSVFFGPKDTEVLKSLNIDAQKIIDFGWFDIIAKPLIMGLNFSHKVTHNFGIDIILLTILIKILFYPLSIKSFKSMREMQKLQPQIQKMKEKFKDDKQKMNQGMMDLYKQKGVNPMGGCLPMVIQIPVFFALYKALSGAIELRHAPFMLWINDLSAPENLYTFHVAGFEVPIRILPLIMGATQLIQQKMTPTSVDPMQEKMMLIMPIVFTFLFYGFSSGLVLYWLVNNVISIAQQYYFNRKTA